MNEGNLIGFVSLGILVCINIATVAYGYGRITQEVKNLCGRVDKLEKRVFGGTRV